MRGHLCATGKKKAVTSRRAGGVRAQHFQQALSPAEFCGLALSALVTECMHERTSTLTFIVVRADGTARPVKVKVFLPG